MRDCFRRIEVAVKNMDTRENDLFDADDDIYLQQAA